MKPRLAYLHLPRFPLQRLIIDHPSLSGRPIILHADDHGSQRVHFASSAALKLGVRPGMTATAAAALAGDLEARHFDVPHFHQALLSVGESLLTLAPAFQLDAPEGLWLDASAAHLCGGEAAWARRVLALLAQAHLRARCVVASERFTSQALARWGEEAVEVVPEQAAAQLAPIPLQALEYGWLGRDATRPFRNLGLSTLGELSGLATGALVSRFGAMGLEASQLSRGRDESGLVPTQPPEVIQESVELDWPAEQLEPVLFALKTLIDRLCGRLQGRQLAAVQLMVALLPQNQPLPLRLARPTSNAKLLLDLVRHRLTDLSVHEPIAGLRVTMTETCADPGRQLMLGDAPAGEAELEVVLSRLQSALGADTLFSATPVAQHRPEVAWASTAFRPPDSGRMSEFWGAMNADWSLGLDTETAPEAVLTVATAAAPEREAQEVPQALPGQAPRSDAEAQVVDLMTFVQAHEGSPQIRAKPRPVETPQTSLTTMLARPTRLFRQPSSLQVELTGDGVMQWVTLVGRRRRVESLQGPERLASGWWETQGYARDYYRVQVEGVGALWVFRDGHDSQFYVQGMFD